MQLLHRADKVFRLLPHRFLRLPGSEFFRLPALSVLLVGYEQPLYCTPWPKWDESKTVDAQVEMAVQVGGKFKGTVTVPTDSDQETVVAAAMELDKVKKAVDGMSVVKTILVKNKLVNLIVKPAK